MTYNQEIQNTLKYFSKDFILDYSGTLNENLFEKYYQFCRGCLNNFSERINITPNIIFFNNLLSINAKAGKYDGTYIITINQGLFSNCITNYLQNENLKNFINQKFRNTISDLDIEVNLLGYQVTTQFTFYHELAHLIQFTNFNNEIELQERLRETEEYCPVRHKLEINADTFASITISTHITQYCERIFQENLSQIKVEETIIITCSYLFNYLNSFSSSNEQIYFEEKTHPHPFFRTLLLTMNLSYHLNSNKFLNERGIRLDYLKIFKKIIDFNEKLEKNKLFDTNFYSNIDNNFEKKERIINFMSELINFNCDDYYDAMEGWNKNIT
ncbi:MAG: hypothetical protein KGV59_07670 [Tenacibaculum sp.]|nr:hypothetical protein [Tenacibaculum sp.]